MAEQFTDDEDTWMVTDKETALRAIKVQIADIALSGIDYGIFAAHLVSKCVISDTQYDRVRDANTGKANDERLQSIIGYVRSNIKAEREAESKLLKPFLKALQKTDEVIGKEIVKAIRKEVLSKEGPSSEVHYPPSLDEEKTSSIKKKTSLNEAAEHSPLIMPSPDEKEKSSSKKGKNEASLVFESLYDTICNILLTEQIEMQFAVKLCAVGLISMAEKDQAKKIENPMIRSKAIVGAVSTMISRGVRPDNLLQRFMSVITLREFDDHFIDMIIELKKKGYEVQSRAVQSSRVASKPLTAGWQDLHSPDDSTVHVVLAAKEVPDVCQGIKDYRRGLEIQYQKLKPSSHDHFDKEWKYFDLACKEESMTKDGRSPGFIELMKIPHKLEYPPRSLIIGAPGTGKSSLITELCRKWANKELLQEYELVILLEYKYHDERPVPHELSDIIPKKWSDQIEDNNGCGCLFIIDGYDELPHEVRKSGFFSNLINRKAITLIEASLIVTTRPSHKEELSQHFQDTEVEVLGFMPPSASDEIPKYIQHSFKQEDDIHSFMENIQKFPHALVNECLCTPFYLAVLIQLYKGHQHTRDKTLLKKFPDTLTKMYGSLVCDLVLRFSEKHFTFSKVLPMPLDILPGEFYKLPDKICKDFMKLCKVSYEAVMKDTAPKAEDDSETFDLAVKKVERIAGRSVYYTFNHSSIKEYLAAYFISQMKPDQIKQLFIAMGKCQRLNLVRQFLSGFPCCAESLAYPSLHKMSVDFDTFHTLRELCETDSNNLINEVLRKVREIRVFRTWPVPSPADFWCLGKVIASSKCNWELGFTNRHLRNDHLKMLSVALQPCQLANDCGQIVKFSLSHNQFDVDGFSHFLNISPNVLSHTKHINISGNHLNDGAAELLSQALNSFPNLKELLIHNNDIENHQPLIEALISRSRVSQVTFSNLHSHECRMLLKDLKTLDTVELWQLNCESIQATVESIPHKRYGFIKRLEIHQSKVSRKSIKDLERNLPDSSISELVMENCGIDSRTISVILNASEKLSELDLSDNWIDLKSKEGQRFLQYGQTMQIKYKHNLQSASVPRPAHSSYHGNQRDRYGQRHSQQTPYYQQSHNQRHMHQTRH